MLRSIVASGVALLPAAPQQAVAAAPLVTAAAPAAPAASCRADTGAQRSTLVEVYTSQGCDSCPPADRWLAALPDAPGTVRLAWHVDYWDRLGWKDPFAQSAYTQRQREQLVVNGSGFAYTPQVVIDGRDRRDWHRLGQRPTASTAGAEGRPSVALVLERDGDRVRARMRRLDGAPKTLSALWVQTESGHVTAVRAGENAGVALRNDHVVRRTEAVPPFGAAEPMLAWEAPRASGGKPRRVVLVVTDAATGRPVQAAQLDC